MNNHKDSIYCFNHAPNSAAVVGKPSPAKKARIGRQRIPCPLDPNHCVWKDKLQRHLRVCEAAKRATVMASLPYVRPGINLAAPGCSNAASKSAAPGQVTSDFISEDLKAGPPRGDAELLRQVTSSAQLRQIFAELLAAYKATAGAAASPKPHSTDICSTPYADSQQPAHAQSDTALSAGSQAHPTSGDQDAAADGGTAPGDKGRQPLQLLAGWSPPAVPQSVAAAERHTLQQEALVELMAHQ